MKHGLRVNIRATCARSHESRLFQRRMQERHLREDSMGRDEQADEGNRNRRRNSAEDSKGEQFEDTGHQTRSRPDDSRATNELDDAGKTNGRIAVRDHGSEGSTRKWQVS